MRWVLLSSIHSITEQVSAICTPASVNGEYSDGSSRAEERETIIDRLLPLNEDENAPDWHGAQVPDHHLDQHFDRDDADELLDFSPEVAEEDFDPFEALFMHED